MLELFRQAGWVAWPLGLCSVLAVAIILERLYTLAGLAKIEGETFAALINAGGAPATAGVSAAAPVAQILAAARNLRGASEEAMLQYIDVALALQRLRLRRYLAALATIGSTAPFIGLFGTVLGVMSAFKSMASSGLNGGTMAAGIAEALSATALGLVVAIPAVFAYNFFLSRVQAFLLEIHGHAIQLLPTLASGQES